MNRIIDEQGRLLQSWRDLFEKYSDRVIFGLDVGPPVDRYFYFDALLQQWRTTLAQLSPLTADKVSHGNIQALMAHCHGPLAKRRAVRR